MNSFSPMATGFRLVTRRPAIPLAEIAWRWSFAAATWILGILFALEYLDSLPASALDRLLMAMPQPILVARAIRHIFQGSALRFTGGALLLAFGLVIAWTLLASFGRAAMLSSLLDDLGVRTASAGRVFFPSLMVLNFIRAAVALAALISSIGAALISNSLWAASHISASDATRVFSLFLFLIWLAWWVLNWLLSTAAIPVVSHGKGALAAVSSTLDICQRHAGPVLRTGVFFLLLHILALVAACAMGLFVLGAIVVVGVGLTLFLELIIVITYCAVADFLYAARMAAYLSILQGGSTPDLARPVSPRLFPGANRPPIDQSPLTLNDLASPSG